tara:strand:+ start:1729 stop:4701 length:2973 start_codon:yes stop_codon:yes gene_type:complete
MAKQLTKIEFQAGVVKDESPLAAEGGFIDSNLVRFRQGKAQTIGGWAKVTTDAVSGSTRALHAWSDLNSRRHLAIATDTNTYVLSEYTDDVFTLSNIATASTAYVTASSIVTSDGSTTITFNATAHGFAASQTFTLNVPKRLGGISLSGTWTVAAVTDANIFTATSGTAAATTMIQSSADAATWTLRTPPATTAALTKVRAANSLFIACAGTYLSSTALYTSSNGSSWSSVTNSIAITDILWDGAQYVATGISSTNGRTYTATTLGTWTQRSTAAGSLYGVTRTTAPLYVAVGASGRITTSTDATTWTARTSGTSDAIYAAATDNTTIVAVGVGVSSTTASLANLRTSTDGTTWTAVASNAANTLFDICYGNSLFVAVGASGAIVTSPTGATWTASTSGVTATLTGVTWTGDEFVAVGYTNTVLTSTNGTTWTTVVTDGDYRYGASVAALSASNMVLVGANEHTSSPESLLYTAAAPFSTAATTRSVSLDSFGEVLLIASPDDGLYCWQPGPYTETVENGTFATDTIWAKGTGWTIGSSVATKTAGVASNLSQAATDLRAGYVYEVSFVLTRTAGTITFQVNAGDTPTMVDVGAPTWTAGGSYTIKFICPDVPSDIAFVADSSFAGTVDTVTINLADDVTEVTTAPSRVGVMWVDASTRVVNVADTIEADGDENMLCVRNSAQENFRLWIPDVSNIADEVVLGRGSQIIGAKVTRQQTLIWTDAAVFTQQFSGGTAATYIYRMASTGCGLIGRNAAAEAEGAVFWLGKNGQIYIFDGQSAKIVESRIRRDMMDNLAAGYGDRVFAGVNGAFSEVWFCYPDTRLSGSPECNKIAAFNYIENHWVTHSLARTAWLAGGVWPYPIATTPSGVIYYHEKGQSDDATAAFLPSLETGYFDIKDGNNIMSVTRIVPDFEEQSTTVNFTIKTKYWPTASELSAGPFAATTTANYLHMRRLGRQMKIVMETVAPDSGFNVFWRVGAVRAVFEETGALR